MTTTKTTRRSAVTLARIATVGYGDETRYAVMFLGTKIGEVFRYTHTTVRCTGGRTYGNQVNATRWEFQVEDGPTPQHAIPAHTRMEAITDLLMVNHYPGRREVAARLARAATTTTTRT